MNFPQNLKYTNEHEWIRVEGISDTYVCNVSFNTNGFALKETLHT